MVILDYLVRVERSLVSSSCDENTLADDRQPRGRDFVTPMPQAMRAASMNVITRSGAVRSGSDREPAESDAAIKSR